MPGIWTVVLERAMDALRCPPEDQVGGIRFPVESGAGLHLCRLLLQQPDILLLDEPTNHLDAECDRLVGTAFATNMPAR